MHSPLPWLANSIWQQSCRSAWIKFQNACIKPAETQQQILLSILDKNKNTTFGKAHRFAQITSAGEYQQAVTVQDYQDLRPYIQQVVHGNKNILTAEPVQRLEPTSGTSGPTKYIPATNGLRAEFQAAIQPWIYNLFNASPKSRGGPAYWFLSPHTPVEQPPNCRINIGFAEDGDYLSTLEKFLLRPIMALPRELAAVQDAETHQYLSLLLLLQEDNLRLLSLWNATSFLILLEKAKVWRNRLSNDLANGMITPPGALSNPLRLQLAKYVKSNRRLSNRILRLLDENNWQAIWPNLQLISCWANSWAERDAVKLHSHFPESLLQPKGLLATEGVVTIPVHDEQTLPVKHVAAVNSHFLEFEEEGSGQVYMLSELEEEKTYSVLLTTSGGLYRYRLNDRVRCSGYWHRTPVLDFIGKTEGFSDIYGEKLSEKHVKAVVQRAFSFQNIDAGFHFIAAHPGKNPFRYSLFYATDTDHNFTTLSEDIERGLCENYHYRHCRSLEQLDAFTAHQISSSAVQKYLRFKSANGQSGTTKFRFLESPEDWYKILL